MQHAVAEDTPREGHGVEDEDAWDDDESEDDIEAEAEDMARRLQEQLRADIERAQQEARAQANGAIPQASQTVPTPSVAATTLQQPIAGPSTPPPNAHETMSLEQLAHGNAPGTASERRSASAILTMKAILASADKNPLVRSTLAASVVPGGGNHNVLDIFNQCITCRKVTKDVAKHLVEAVISLAKSELLFASLRNSDAPAIQLDKGKRRWDAADGPSHDEPPQEPPTKRVALEQPDLRYQVSEAVRLITHALSPIASSPTPMIHPHLIASIHLQLHQVFLFAVTSAPRAGDRATALQELAGLIQMLGVLSGIQIGSQSSASEPQSHTPGWSQSPGAPDIGTAVYPCLTCPKVFARLFSLKAHQRVHLLVERPFRCDLCVASFVRNHDLKRHARLHERRAYRCGGCGKVFSRRDAIKRHQDNRRGVARGRTGDDGAHGAFAGVAESVCAYAEIVEVEVDRPESEEEAVRRAKMWDGIAASTMQFNASANGGAPPMYTNHPLGPDDGPEEGEMHPGVVLEAQAIVLGLHPMLHGYVTKVLGHAPVLQNTVQPPLGQQPTPQAALAQPPPVSAGQPTLASVIASANANGGFAMPMTETSQTTTQADVPSASSALSSALSLSEEQTRLLEQAIAQAALAAQAQAEAEAALEEEDEGTDDEDDEEDG